ncbi:MAG: transcriptional regulator [Alphaproteobacteria bacterium 32-64-14]|nr:MAG: transcriptional regulator [Alphaproteobacteria bacterium 32-64-14]
MQTNLRTLGPNEARLVLTLREQARDIVQRTEIIDLLGSATTARKVISNLIRKGWLTRLVGGRYMFLPPEHGPENFGENNALALAAAAVSPSYVGWWSAASFHGLTTQKPMSVSVAVLKQAPTRTIEGTEVRFVKVAPRKFFGFEPYPVYGRKVAISTPAKTAIDCLDRPELAGGATELTRILFGASTQVDPRELINAAEQMKSVALLQRLGFLTDLIGWTLPADVVDRLHAGIPKPARSKFGRMERKDGDIGYVASWGLFVHARHSDLLSDTPSRRIKTS